MSKNNNSIWEDVQDLPRRQNSVPEHTNATFSRPQNCQFIEIWFKSDIWQKEPLSSGGEWAKGQGGVEEVFVWSQSCLPQQLFDGLESILDKQENIRGNP